jgi:precorrin-6Y C5,15-methyltransferase (decarboxylating)
VGILTDDINSPSAVAEAILRSSAGYAAPFKCEMTVCERLGYPDERITIGAPDKIAAMEFREPNIVVASDIGREVHPPLFGINESEFVHNAGLITKDEVRAVSIHKLRLLNGGVFWDIGAGSGLVSVEVARLFPSCRVFAAEKDPMMIEKIRKNSAAFAAKIKIIEGEAPLTLEGLPDPDRVFIGGSGGRLDGIISYLSGLMKGGIIVINAVTIESLNEAISSLDVQGFAVDVSQVAISRSKPIGDRNLFAAQNPVFVIRGVRK